MDLRVVVGSTNPVRINSTRQSFESVFGSKVRTITVTGIKSQSEVSVRRFYVFLRVFYVFLPIKVRYRPRVSVFEMKKQKKEKTC